MIQDVVYTPTTATFSGNFLFKMYTVSYGVGDLHLYFSNVVQRESPKNEMEQLFNSLKASDPKSGLTTCWNSDPSDFGFTYRYVHASASFLAEISVSSPRKILIFILKKYILSGSKYPTNTLFKFENRSTGSRPTTHWHQWACFQVKKYIYSRLFDPIHMCLGANIISYFLVIWPMHQLEILVWLFSFFLNSFGILRSYKY